MYAGASESVTTVRHLIRAAGRHGLRLDEGPTACEPAFSARISALHAQRLWERAVGVLGPRLPLLVAGASDSNVSLLQLAAGSCRTMGEAVQLTVEHWRYLTDAFRATTALRGGDVYLQLAVGADLPLGVRLGVEYLLAALVRAGRALSGGAWRPIAVELGHRPPLALEAWEAACGVPVRVAASSGLVLSRASLTLPVCAERSRAAGRLFRELLAHYTPRTVALPTLAQRVAAALGRDLGGAAPSVEHVAGELGLSARSLHRQLAAEGTSYQRVLDAVRCDEASRQTLEQRRPFKAIAAAVGFADPRAFRRAFKRWTGSTPQQFRLRALG